MGLCHPHEKPECTDDGRWLAIVDNDSHSLATTEVCDGSDPPPTPTAPQQQGPCPGHKFYDPDHPDADPDGCRQRMILN